MDANTPSAIRHWDDDVAYQPETMSPADPKPAE